MKDFIPTPAFYKKLAEELINEIDDRTYVSTDIEIPDFNGFSLYFKATIIVYRDRETFEIVDILPIWWEFEAYDFDGNRVSSDGVTFAEIRDTVKRLV